MVEKKNGASNYTFPKINLQSPLSDVPRAFIKGRVPWIIAQDDEYTRLFSASDILELFLLQSSRDGIEIADVSLLDQPLSWLIKEYPNLLNINFLMEDLPLISTLKIMYLHNILVLPIIGYGQLPGVNSVYDDTNASNQFIGPSHHDKRELHLHSAFTCQNIEEEAALQGLPRSMNTFARSRANSTSSSTIDTRKSGYQRQSTWHEGMSLNEEETFVVVGMFDISQLRHLILSPTEIFKQKNVTMDEEETDGETIFQMPVRDFVSKAQKLEANHQNNSGYVSIDWDTSIRNVILRLLQSQMHCVLVSCNTTEASKDKGCDVPEQKVLLGSINTVNLLIALVKLKFIDDLILDPTLHKKVIHSIKALRLSTIAPISVDLDEPSAPGVSALQKVQFTEFIDLDHCTIPICLEHGLNLLYFKKDPSNSLSGSSNGFGVNFRVLNALPYEKRIFGADVICRGCVNKFLGCIEKQAKKENVLDGNCLTGRCDQKCKLLLGDAIGRSSIFPRSSSQSRNGSVYHLQRGRTFWDQITNFFQHTCTMKRARSSSPPRSQF